jgi:RNA polymerase sigma factor (sigma-70 family)
MSWDGIRELLSRAKAGDAGAWARLQALAQPFLLRKAGQLLAGGPQESAGDLTQETWLRAWQGLHAFAGADTDADTAALFRAWLAQVLKSVRLNDLRCRNAQRRRPPPGTVRLGAENSSAPAGRLDVPAPGPTPSAGMRAEEQRRLVGEALRALPDETDRAVLSLYFEEGLSLTRIAERLGTSLDRARRGFHRGLEALRPHLGSLQ